MGVDNIFEPPHASPPGIRMPPQFNGCVPIGDTVGHAVTFMHRFDSHVSADSEMWRNRMTSQRPEGSDVTSIEESDVKLKARYESANKRRALMLRWWG
jgi:hypothetical protein